MAGRCEQGVSEGEGAHLGVGNASPGSREAEVDTARSPTKQALGKACGMHNLFSTEDLFYQRSVLLLIRRTLVAIIRLL
jgi:hypothetical protein